MNRTRCSPAMAQRTGVRATTARGAPLVVGSVSSFAGFSKAWDSLPRGSIYTTIMDLGPKRPSPLWFLRPNSIIVVYMDPLG